MGKPASIYRLEIVQDMLIDLDYHDSFLMTSKRKVPYLWVSRKKLNVSVCYFMGAGVFKVWTGCGTPENKKVASGLKSEQEVLELLKEILCLK